MSTNVRGLCTTLSLTLKHDMSNRLLNWYFQISVDADNSYTVKGLNCYLWSIRFIRKSVSLYTKLNPGGDKSDHKSFGHYFSKTFPENIM